MIRNESITHLALLVLGRPLDSSIRSGQVTPGRNVGVLHLLCLNGVTSHLTGWSQYPRLNNSATSQAHIQGTVLNLLNIYTIFDLLEHMKPLVQWNHSNGISMTQSNSRIFHKRFVLCPVLMVYQKPEALNLTNNTLHNEHLKVKLS